MLRWAREDLVLWTLGPLRHRRGRAGLSGTRGLSPCVWEQRCAAGPGAQLCAGLSALPFSGSQQLPGHGRERPQDQVLGPAAALRAHQQHQAVPQHGGGLAAALQRGDRGPGQLLRLVSAGVCRCPLRARGPACCWALVSSPGGPPGLSLPGGVRLCCGEGRLCSCWVAPRLRGVGDAVLQRRRGGHGEGWGC